METQVSFEHLVHLTTERGLYEHAIFDKPRPEHGYCLDDVARALVLLGREPQLDPVTSRLFDLYLAFTLNAVSDAGTCHNRMDVSGRWTDEPGLGDCWGRAMWALGVCAALAPGIDNRAKALAGFRRAAQVTSPNLMSMTFAALGAGELLLASPGETSAIEVLHAAKAKLTKPFPRSDWPWPEPRLRYSNGSIAEATMITGQALGDRSTIGLGLSMLGFLLSIERSTDHFSVTPVCGRGPGELEPGFDQQPIELAAIADASARAWAITRHPRWLGEIQRSWNWFLGANDVGVQMFDPMTSAGYDGLQVNGPNLNRGAESTIAMLSTAQRANRLGKKVEAWIHQTPT